MCLLTTWEKPKIAKYDFEVYKKLHEYNSTKATSIYQDFIYNLNELYKTEIKETIYRSNADEIDCQWEIDNNHSATPEKIYWYGEGFHAATTKDRLKTHDGNLYLCRIPKGSKYFLDPTGLIISDQIIIEKKTK